MAKKPEISVCIIAKNEQDMLPACLESVQVFAGEIILVDTGSDDDTIKIARQFGCEIVESEWQNDFSYSRNIALSHATKPFILSIDADERIVNPDEVINAISNSPGNTGGWLIEVTSKAVRKDGSVDTYVSNLLRLFINHPKIRFYGAIHEQIVDPIAELGYKLNNTQIKIDHLGYGFGADAMKKKQLRNLELLIKSIEVSPGDGYNLYQLAKTYLALDDKPNAEKYIQLALEYSPPDGAVLPQALNYGGVIAYQSGNHALAVDRAKQSLAKVPNQAFANFVLGESYSAINDFHNAYAAYKDMEASLNCSDLVVRIVGDYRLPPEQLAFRLGRSMIGLKKYDEAGIHFKEGLRLKPDDTNCLVGLANVHFFNQRLDDALEILKKANLISPGRSDILSFVRQVEDKIKLREFKKNISKSGDKAKENRPSEAAANIKLSNDILSNDRISNNKFSSGKILDNELFNDKLSTDNKLLSLCMIVKNEEELLPGCLESVRGLVDEIIVIDTGSADRTVEIAESFGAKVYYFDWVDDFAAARNESIKHSTGRWILYLDADERLDRQSSENMREILESAADETGGLICTIESEHVQLDGNTELHRGGYPRLFRNYGYPKIHFKGRVHEQITPSLRELNKNLEFTGITIQHLGYNQSREVMEAKVRRNYKMLIAHVKEEPLNGYAWYQLGQTLAQMNLMEQAGDAIKFAVGCGDLSDSIFASAAATLAQMAGAAKNYGDALDWAERSLKKAPGQMFAMNLRAYALLYLGRLEESEQAFLEIKSKINTKRGVPLSGFDIEISVDVVDKGLAEVRKRRAE